MRTVGGVTAIWPTNQASEINRPFDWSKARRDFLLHSVTTSGWQQSAGGKGSEIKGFEMERSVVKIHGKGKSLRSLPDNHGCLQASAPL